MVGASLVPAGLPGRAFTLIAALMALCCGPPETSGPVAPDAPGEWRRWRGPNGQGVSVETDLPETWDEGGGNIRWRTWLPGAGSSSPIASQGRIFLTTTYADESETWQETWGQAEIHRVVLGLDLVTGEILWKTPVFHGNRGKVHYSSSRAVPTPATDGESVFVSFDGILTALNFAGQTLWQKDLDPDYYLHAHYGASTSPIVAGEAVILMQDREEGDSADEGWIVALDKKSGELLWRDAWTHTCCSYTTPILMQREEGRELVISSSKEVVAYDPATGERLWRAEASNTQPVPSLVVSGDLVCSPGAMHDRHLTMFRLHGSGKETRPEVLWSTHRKVPKIPTPLFYLGRFFVLTDNRILTAYEPETGNELWRGRVSPGDYRPSLVAGDGKLYTLNEYGVVTVVDATADRFRKISENSIGEGNHGATLAIAGGCILIRTENHLVCAAKPSEAAAAPAQ